MRTPTEDSPASAEDQTGSTEFLQSLLDLLSDDNPGIVSYAAKALRDHGEDSVVQALRQRLETCPTSCVTEIVATLDFLHSGTHQDLFDELLACPSPDVRATAIEKVGARLQIDSRPRILALLGAESEPRCRASLISLLGKMKSDLPPETLIPSLRDRDSRVRANALDLLGKLPSLVDDSLIEPLLDDASPRVRASAMRLLWPTRHEELWKRVQAELESDDLRRELSATYLLGHLPGPAEALQELTRRLEHSNVQIRLLASKGLLTIPGQIDVDSLVERYLAEEHTIVRQNLMAYCRRRQPVAAIQALKKLMSQGVLKPETRATAVRAMGDLVHARAIPTLVSTLKDSDPRVRSNAVEALSRCPGEGLMALLLPCLEDSNHRVRATAALAIWRLGGHHAVEVLLKMLESGNTASQTSAAFALGEIGSSEMVVPLSDLLHDLTSSVVTTEAQRLVQKSVMKALTKIRSA